eukprot:6519397-Pyramimonas_sp.AAC.1
MLRNNPCDPASPDEPCASGQRQPGDTGQIHAPARDWISTNRSNRTAAPCIVSFQQVKERTATLEENVLAACDPGPQRIRDEEKRLDPLIRV